MMITRMIFQGIPEKIIIPVCQRAIHSSGVMPIISVEYPMQSGLIFIFLNQYESRLFLKYLVKLLN